MTAQRSANQGSLSILEAHFLERGRSCFDRAQAQIRGADDLAASEEYCTLDDILRVLDCLATRAELNFRRPASGVC